MHLTKYLAQWLAQYAKTAGKPLFVIPYQGLRTEALVIHLCSLATEMVGGLSMDVLGNVRLDPKIYAGTVTSGGFPTCELYLDCYRHAQEHSGIVVGNIDKTTGLYTRVYEKLGEANADIFPLFDVNYSEIVNITDSLWPNTNWENELSKESIYILEFCTQSENLYGIITSEEPPHKHPRWPYFIAEQKAGIAEIHQREKKTRHKALAKPYPKVYAK